MRFKYVRPVGWCVAFELVSAGCNLQRVGEPEGKPEAVAVATQALKVETPERLAVKRLADMQATGADIDQQKAMLARGEVKDPVAYAEIEGEIEGKPKARMALEGGMPAAATPDTTAVALPARTSAQAAKERKLPLARRQAQEPPATCFVGSTRWHRTSRLPCRHPPATPGRTP